LRGEGFKSLLNETSVIENKAQQSCFANSIASVAPPFFFAKEKVQVAEKEK